MSVDGTWRLEINSPMGKQDISIDLKQDGDRLTGLMTNNANGMSSEIFDGVLDGTEGRWKAKLQHVKLTLAYTVNMVGDDLTGKVKAGVFGTFDVVGKRG